MDLSRLRKSYLANPENHITAGAYRRELLYQKAPCYIFDYAGEEKVVGRILQSHALPTQNFYFCIFEDLKGDSYLFVNNKSLAAGFGRNMNWQADGWEAPNLFPTICLKDWYIIPRSFRKPVKTDFGTIGGEETNEDGVVPSDWLFRLAGQPTFLYPGGLNFTVLKEAGETRIVEQVRDGYIDLDTEHGYAIDYNNPVKRGYHLYPTDVSFGKKVHASWLDAFKELWEIFAPDAPWQYVYFQYLCANGKFHDLVFKNHDDDDFYEHIKENYNDNFAIKLIPYDAILGARMLEEDYGQSGKAS